MVNKKTVLNSKIEEVLEEKQKKTELSRRSFLKKSAYSAPVLMAMGNLVKPTPTHADFSTGPDGPPAQGWNP
ncbi:MAG: hypothetical protein OQK45_03945 [Sulfurovum sp.]|nr:hypothetical protein [Sulfurovum sp.]